MDESGSFEHTCADGRRASNHVPAGATRYPLYDGAVRGIANYWYPVYGEPVAARGKPKCSNSSARKIMFLRGPRKRVCAQRPLPHRGVPPRWAGKNSAGRSVAATTAGRTTQDRALVAALTDGPDSASSARRACRRIPSPNAWASSGCFTATERPLRSKHTFPRNARADRSSKRASRNVTVTGVRAENGFDEVTASICTATPDDVFQSSAAFVRTVIGPTTGMDTRKTTQATALPTIRARTVAEKPFGKSRRSIVTVSIALTRRIARALREMDPFRVVRADAGRAPPLLAVRGQKTSRHRRRRVPALVLAAVAVGLHVQFNDQDTAMVELMQTPPEHSSAPITP